MAEYSKCGLASADWKGTATSQKLLAALLLMQPGMCLAFVASRAHCWPVFNNFSTSGPALQSCSFPSWSPACLVARASSVPCEGPYICSVELHEVSVSQKGCTMYAASANPSSLPPEEGLVLCVSLWVLAFWLLPEAHGWETSLHPTALANSSALQNICGL